MKVRQDPSTKPYFKCLSCARFRKSCGGIPTRGMDLQEWCEYMRDVKDLAHLTNADIAKDSGVSKATIEKIMAINYETDIMRSTARRIELVVVGPVGEHDCDVDRDGSKSAERLSKLLSENEQLKEQIRQIDDLHRQDIRIIKEEYQEQITFLKDELKAWRDWHKNGR